MLSQEKHLKETQALCCWSTHRILHLVLSLQTRMNSQIWCQWVNASEAWVKQDLCLCLSNHLPAKSEPWPSKEEKSPIILIPWFGAFQVILWVILGFLISKMGSLHLPCAADHLRQRDLWAKHPGWAPDGPPPRAPSPLPHLQQVQVFSTWRITLLSNFSHLRKGEIWLQEGKIPFCS